MPETSNADFNRAMRDAKKQAGSFASDVSDAASQATDSATNAARNTAGSFEKDRMKTGGKRAGQHNKATIERQRMLQSAGITPINRTGPLAKEVLQECMNTAIEKVRF